MRTAALAARNATSARIVALAEAMSKDAQPHDHTTDILDRHRRLAWAIANGDPDEAERCMGAHFDEAIGSLLR